MEMETYLEELQSLISDMHKDAYGFRPRGEQFWSSLTTVDACRAKLEELDEAVGAVIAEDAAREAKAVERFEALVQTMINHGASDRATALRWALDTEAADSNGELEWALGLPMGYLKEAA